MDVHTLMIALFLVTALAVIVFALVSKARVERRMRDENAPKSTLAADAPNERNT